MTVIPIRALEGIDLRALAQAALYAEAVKVNAPDREYDEAIVAAFEARQNFLSALRVVTGINDRTWTQLVREGLLP